MHTMQVRVLATSEGLVPCATLYALEEEQRHGREGDWRNT